MVKVLLTLRKATLNAYGLEEVMYEGLTRGEKDFNALITKIRSVDADVVYFGGPSLQKLVH